MDLASMQWSSGANRYRLEFEGDTFETEDQRNWTDASFKTYCTPLADPFPVMVQSGDTIRQQVILKLLNTDTTQKETEASVSLRLTGARAAFPAVGVAQAPLYKSLAEEEIRRLQKIGFSHYRAEIRWYEDDYRDQWKRAVQESHRLQLPLELVMHFGTEGPSTLGQIETLQQQYPADVRYLLLFQQGAKVTPDPLLAHSAPLLRALFPQAKIGAGTDCFFAELNRQRVTTEPIDFINYSVNPQVHHFDNQSLVETLSTQAETVRSAQAYSNDCPVHVSPVTLKMRFNPNATAASSGPTPAERLAARTDTRQLSLLGAGWTLGSIKYLSEAEVEAVTYYETIGNGGMIGREEEDKQHPLFASLHGRLFPAYWVFYYLLGEQRQQTMLTQSSHPLMMDGLALAREDHTLLMLANWQSEPIAVSLPDFPGVREQRTLTQHNFIELTDDTWIDSPWEEASGPCPLDAYGIAILRIKNSVP